MKLVCARRGCDAGAVARAGDAARVVRRRTFAHIGFTVLILSGCFTMAGCESSIDRITNLIDLPAEWTYGSGPSSTHEQDDSVAGFELHADGTALVWNFPGGQSRRVDGYLCFDRSGHLFTGEATWETTSGGALTLTHEETTVLWADPGFLGSFDWVTLTLADCDETGRSAFDGHSRYGETYRSR